MTSHLYRGYLYRISAGWDVEVNIYRMSDAQRGYVHVIKTFARDEEHGIHLAERLIDDDLRTNDWISILRNLPM